MAHQFLRCIVCHRSFLHTEGERQFFASRGLSQPRRCKTCRALAGKLASAQPNSKAPLRTSGRKAPRQSTRPEMCRFCNTPHGATFETQHKGRIPHGATMWARDGDDAAPWLYTVRILSIGPGRWRCQYCGKSW